MVNTLDDEFSLLSSVALLRPRDGVLQAGYFAYHLNDPLFKSRVLASAQGGAMTRLTVDAISRFTLVLPPPADQTAIVAFLDRETAKIDALIAEQQRLIELLKEKRQAVISHAVAKGLNPDAPMKDSGIEWLGEVPEHWTAIKIKQLYCQEKRQGYPDLPVLSVYREYGVIEKESREDNNNKTPENLDYYQRVNPGDLVINKMKAWQGSLGVSCHEGITSPDYIVYKSTHRESSDFIHYMLRQRNLAGAYKAISNGIRPQQWRLETDKFEHLTFFLPPKEEQNRIVEFLSGYSVQLDKLATEAQTAISFLQERRTALISAAVTGKIDVRRL
jgi:type I restriction enzyme S subunit